MRVDIALSLVTACAVALVCGCAGTTSTPSPTARDDQRPSVGSGGAGGAHAAEKATAAESTYTGWKAIKLTNGLVTVVVVPDVGGRIMDFRLGDHALLWNNAAEAGKLYDAPRTAEERTWHNFGGYKVWPAPQDRWGGPPDPLGSTLEGGRWTSRIVTASGPTAVVELTSPADEAVTGLQASRTIRLGVGTTSLEVTETFRNVSQRPVDWSIWTIAQVPGSLRPGEAVSPEARAYLPLPAKSRHAAGYYEFPFNESPHWKPIAGGRVLELTYGGEAAKVGVDATEGWLASVDDLNGFTYAATFDLVPGAEYPDEGCSIEAWMNPSDLPYMEMEILSPITKLEPGKSFSATQTWHATRLNGPVLSVGKLAAIRVAPAINAAADKTTLTGELGVFAPGSLTVELRDGAGKALGSAAPVKVSPTAPVKLNLALRPTAGATCVALLLRDPKGKLLGELASLDLPAAPPAQ